MRQLRLVPSGVQAWGHRDMIAATTDAFAYSSTMALHVFKLKDNRLYRMIAAHERMISAICWSHQDINLLASCSISGNVAIWNIEEESTCFVAKLPDTPVLMDWAAEGDKISFVQENGEIRLWTYKEDNGKLTKLFSIAANSGRVLRWHPRDSIRMLVGTAEGALVVYNQSTGKKTSILGKSKTSKDAVTDAQWDPLSDDYFLVAFADGCITLYDSVTDKEIHSFDKQSQPVKSLVWARSQPGNFVTVSDRIGVLKLWNVSQKAPMTQMKVGSTGVNCIKEIPSEPNWFVLSFKDSAVGICDIATWEMRFTTSPGHSETIFDVVFHPEDPDIMATASYDGRVKVWNVNNMESKRELNAGKDQVLYGVSFSPNASRICAVSIAGVLFIWRTDNGENLLRLQLHTGQCYRCEWNPQALNDGSGEIATGGADGLACVVDGASGAVLRKITHPSGVIGVTWHATEDKVLATACQDGHVRIYELGGSLSSSSTPTPADLRALVTMKGHDARVFNLSFHPICPELLASGSDDKTVRVWNWYQSHTGNRELRKLVGHTSYVRGLLWHTELPHILFSGSWDSTIHVWNVATAECLHIAYEHHADVYGLTLHPRRPFLLVSSSRDTTIRFWSFEDDVRPLLTEAIVRPSNMGALLGRPDDASRAIIAGQTPPLRLYGQGGYNLAHTVLIALAGQPPGLPVYQSILSFFIYRQGIDDLWGLLSVLRGEPATASSSTSRGAYHERELIQCMRSKALELASSRPTLGLSMKLEDRLIQAAQIMLRIGDFRSYCRFLAQAGQWERAICMAPAVSHQFWVELSTEYMDSMRASTDLEEVAPLMVATGQAAKLVDAYIERGDLDTAFVVAKADSEGLMPASGGSSGSGIVPTGLPSDGNVARARLEDVAAALASKYSDDGEPLKAAMCFLSVSASYRAVLTLSRASEIVLAFAVAELLSQPQDAIVINLMARCSERDQRWSIAAELYQRSQMAAFHLPLLQVRMGERLPDLNLDEFTPDMHRERIDTCWAAGQYADAVLAAVCSGETSRAIDLGVDALHSLFSRGGWALEEARALLLPLESLTLQSMSVREIASVLSCAAYIGLVEASSLGYDELMFPLAQTLRNLITHQELNFPIDNGSISYLEAMGTAKLHPQNAMALLKTLISDISVHEHIRADCEEQYKLLQLAPPSLSLPAADGPGLGKLAGARLPVCYRRHAKVSVLTNELIRGPSFALENRKMHISLHDALAWTRVNVFSPLNTGWKMSPI